MVSTVADWLLTGCSQLLTLEGPVPRRGRALAELSIVRDGALLIRGGLIRAVGPRRQIERLREAQRVKKLDLGGGVVLPGFVDAHTHLIFPASRAAEYEQRISGASYREIVRQGGGIRRTVEALRRAPPKTLKDRAVRFLREFAAHGTTTLEAKSGYGLNGESELKILEVLAELHQEQPLDIVATFLGAHIVPPEFRKRPDAWVEWLVKRLIPSVAAAGLAEYCDVFCDRGGFTVPQARKVLAAGRCCGLVPRIHAEQFARSGAVRLAIECEAASADHLEHLNARDIQALGASRVACILLPGCSFHLGLSRYAPARALISAGAIVALATDFNPGTSPTLSMPMILSLACTHMHMTPAEAIAAATINPAYSLGLHERIASFAVGKYADLAVFDVADYREIPYYFGVNLCSLTMKRGAIVHSKNP